MPFYLTDYPSGLVPFPRLVIKLDHPNLNAALWRTTRGTVQMRLDELLQAVVAGKPDEVGDAATFAKLLQVRTGEGCIPSEPKTA